MRDNFRLRNESSWASPHLLYLADFLVASVSATATCEKFGTTGDKSQSNQENFLPVALFLVWEHLILLLAYQD